MVKVALALLVLAVLVAAAAAPAADDPILLALTEVKTYYRQRDIGKASAALKRLNELAAAPDYAAVLERLLPVLSFYNGVIQFETGDEAGARLALERYLGFQPAATLDPALYPKKFIAFFEGVKKDVAEGQRLSAPPASPGAIEGGLLPSYAEFALNEEAADALERDPAWGSGPVRFLFVGDEAKRWKNAVDESDRRRFQQEFWARRNPNPAASVNEFRGEFARRVQFAQSNFSTETQRGAESDRGMVLILLGPPNYAGRSQMNAEEDGVTLATDLPPRLDGVVGLRDRPQGRNNRIEEDRWRLGSGQKRGMREAWYYRVDRLSKELPYGELRFEFQTRDGYGAGVLQKDAVNLSVLSRMAEIYARPK